MLWAPGGTGGEAVGALEMVEGTSVVVLEGV